MSLRSSKTISPKSPPAQAGGVSLEPDADGGFDRVQNRDDRSVAHNCSDVVRAESAARVAVSGAENVPRHIRAQLLATNLSVRGSFNKGAVLGRNAFAVPPHSDVALPKVQSGSERRLTAEHLNCAVECFHAAIKHERNSKVNTNVFRVSGTNPDMSGKTLAERLTEARKRLGWSQAVLAERAGVSQSTIGNLESGTRSRPRNLLTIASALGVSAVWLEFGTGRMLADNPQLRPDVDELASLMQSRLNEEQVAKLRELVLALAGDSTRK